MPKLNKVKSLIDWATSEPPSPGGSKCGVCKHEEIRKAIDAIVDLRNRGVVTVSKTQLHQRLKAEFPEWKVGFYVLRDHIDKHTKGWNAKT